MSKPIAESLNGFEFYYKCSCGGTLQHKYRRKDNHKNRYIIYPNKSQVRIFKENIGIGIFSILKLQEKITEHGI